MANSGLPSDLARRFASLRSGLPPSPSGVPSPNLASSAAVSDEIIDALFDDDDDDNFMSGVGSGTFDAGSSSSSSSSSSAAPAIARDDDIQDVWDGAAVVVAPAAACQDIDEDGDDDTKMADVAAGGGSSAKDASCSPSSSSPSSSSSSSSSAAAAAAAASPPASSSPAASSSTFLPEDAIVVYWERQQAAFCGIHAVNNALQVPLFEEKDFRQFARELDEAEAKLLGVRPPPPGRSVNVDRSGNYSISVILAALRRADMQGEPILGDRAKSLGVTLDPAGAAEAYICHRKNHFFAMRRLHGIWYHLDSLLKQPRRLSDEQLVHLVAKLALEGYTVYCVLGTFPKPIAEQPARSQISNRGQWFDCHGRAIAGTDVRFRRAQSAGSRAASVAQDAQAKAMVAFRQAKAYEGAGRDPEEAYKLYKAGCQHLMVAISSTTDAGKKAKLSEVLVVQMDHAATLRKA